MTNAQHQINNPDPANPDKNRELQKYIDSLNNLSSAIDKTLESKQEEVRSPRPGG